MSAQTVLQWTCDILTFANDELRVIAAARRAGDGDTGVFMPLSRATTIVQRAIDFMWATPSVVKKSYTGNSTVLALTRTAAAAYLQLAHTVAPPACAVQALSLCRGFIDRTKAALITSEKDRAIMRAALPPARQR
eukprot:8581-Heterococcus_DN1.PRE.2